MSDRREYNDSYILAYDLILRCNVTMHQTVHLLLEYALGFMDEVWVEGSVYVIKSQRGMKQLTVPRTGNNNSFSIQWDIHAVGIRRAGPWGWRPMLPFRRYLAGVRYHKC